MPIETEWFSVHTPDGRVLEVLSAGDEDAFPLVFHVGTPSAATPFARTTDAAARHGLRLIEFSRPGYAGSTPKPGRRVADVAADVATILDALGLERFVAVGFSGGGPHALACAALLPDRCAAVATVGGVAPYPAEGLDWLAGMGPENVEEFGRTLAGEAELVPYLLGVAAQLATVEPAHVVAALGGLVGEVDKAALTGDYAEWAAETFHRSVSTGIGGWRDDDFAFAADWGFDLASIARPVAIWQGGDDRMVPFAHGEWLARHIPTATAHLLPDEGHLSLGVTKLDQILEDLVASAGNALGSGLQTGPV
jgi:pimeloyl-ACP methyl ester carboxylesterase